MPYITDYQYYENGGTEPQNANWGVVPIRQLAGYCNQLPVDVQWESLVGKQ